MEFTEISIVGGIVLILLLFALIGFVKGIFKTALALLNLAVAGFSAWWGYNHATSYLSQWIPNQPEYMSIVYATLGGVVTFCVLYKLFSFIANPFESDEEKSSWGFGAPAAIVSVILAIVFVFFALNRMRETNELHELKEMMTHGVDHADERSGVHKFVMEKLESNKVGQFILGLDPLWDCNREKLTKSVICYFKEGPDSNPEDAGMTELMNDPGFQNWIKSNSADLLEAVKNQDPSQLWESGALDQFLADEDGLNKLEGVE